MILNSGLEKKKLKLAYQNTIKVWCIRFRQTLVWMKKKTKSIIISEPIKNSMKGLSGGSCIIFNDEGYYETFWNSLGLENSKLCTFLLNAKRESKSLIFTGNGFAFTITIGMVHWYDVNGKTRIVINFIKTRYHHIFWVILLKQVKITVQKIMMHTANIIRNRTKASFCRRKTTSLKICRSPPKRVSVWFVQVSAVEMNSSE